MIYAITGASGQLGRLVIEALLRTVPPSNIIAAVRDETKAQDLAKRGVLVRHADYNQPETLDSALSGVDKLLLISSTEISGRLPQHEAVIDAAKRSDVSFLAFTSMLHADSSLARLAIEHRQTEEAIARSGLPAAILRNGWYTENHLVSLPAAREHGAFIGAASDGRFSSAARKDYAEAAAVVLTGDGHVGRTYELASDIPFTLAEFAAEVSRQAGREIVYNDLSEANYMAALAGAGLPEDLAALLADADAAAAQGALYDNGGALSRLIGRPTTPLATIVAGALRD